MLANIDVRINLDSSIGQCGLVIEAELKNADKAAQLAGQYLLFHKAASKAFNGDAEKLGYTRKSAYSEDLGKHVVANVKLAFAPVFDIISIESKPEVKLTDEEKFVREMVKIGIDADYARAEFAKVQAAKSAKPTEEPAKPTESVN